MAEKLTDIHLHVVETESGPALDMDGSLAFPGPRPIQTDWEREVATLAFQRAKNVQRREFSIRISAPETMIFRVQRVTTAIDGIWLRLRRSSVDVPDFSSLPLRLPQYVVDNLVAPEISRGGLVLVCGQPGSGKTTTASATVVERLRRYGGFGYTIEDPPEILALNGWHGNGYCTQTEVPPHENGWGEAIKDLLRSQPAGSNLLLFVGEVRTSNCAEMMLRAALNGFLTITTSFASDIPSGIETLFHLLGRDRASALASALRVVVFQRILLDPVRRLEALSITFDGPDSRAATLVRTGQLEMLRDEVQYQVNRARRAMRINGEMP